MKKVLELIKDMSILAELLLRYQYDISKKQEYQFPVLCLKLVVLFLDFVPNIFLYIKEKKSKISKK
jgi:hypothetical protein